MKHGGMLTSHPSRHVPGRTEGGIGFPAGGTRRAGGSEGRAALQLRDKSSLGLFLNLPELKL